MNKRLLSLVLALAMSLSLAAPTTAFAAESTEEPVTVYADEAAENTPADTETEPGTEPEQPTQPVEKLPQEITGVKTAYNLYMTKLDYALRPVTNGDGALTFATSDPDVVTVDETTGLLTPVAVGTASITITAAETEQYLAAEQQVTIKVILAKQTITGVPEALDLKYKANGTYQLKAKAASKLTYKSSNTKVATVDSKGKLTMKGLGTVVITITANADGRYAKATHKVEIEVYKTAAKLKVSKYYKKSKFYKRLMKLHLDGTTRQNVMAIAETQVGYHEGNKLSQMDGANKRGSGNYTEYGYVYGIQGAWCAMFVNWCARENATSTKVVPKYCRVMDYRGFYQKQKRYYPWSKTKGGRGSYLPKAGDMIFYTTYPGASSQHIGYVKSCKVKGGKITIVTTEGNSSDECRHKTYTLPTKSNGRIAAGWYIHGFSSPKY